MMKITGLLFFIPAFCFGQLSPEINKLYDELSKSKRVESAAIGYGGSESEVYKLFVEIDKKASDKEVEYIAFNGNPVAKTYGSYSVFNRKLKILDQLFDSYLKNNEPISIIQGCVGSNSHLADELYKMVFWEKDNIKATEVYRKHKASIKTEHELSNFIQLFDAKESKWTMKEIDSVLIKFDRIVLDNPSSPQNLVELITESYFFIKRKHPEYHDKLAYFEKKYNSEEIKKYLKFSGQ
ncbi:hypothetical protein SAMN05444360_104212 [Chryseobacterium carnipullorum]|uniref:hypothetical protein n=1 Tax=Chryseobacterium carnipullorum TaxID=1124835 RepID=UPI00091BDD89|nr:hypothetical protein [Chryseobacterium carnipullorum]SHL79532.1 hypothetical protein SAMN05444360_104212 [Chryseobacterium carnipullorum]